MMAEAIRPVGWVMRAASQDELAQRVVPLLLEKASRRPLHAPQSELVQRLLEVGPLSADDEKSLLHMLEAIEAKNKLKALAAKVG
jgi:hypothetical protein